jgi:transcriptional regulator with XRE-family HTH domain
MKMQHASLSEQIRAAVRASGLGRNALARAAGIDKSSVSRFTSGERGLSLGGLDHLAAALGLVVKVQGKAGDAWRRKGRCARGAGGRSAPARGG